MSTKMSKPPLRSGSVPPPAHGMTRWPAGRVHLTSTAGSAAIDYLLPEAHRDYLCGTGPYPHPETFYDAGLEMDEPAHAVLAAQRSVGPQVRAQFETALEQGIEAVTDPAPEIVAFYETVDKIPAAIDMDLVAEGARVFRRIDPLNGVIGAEYMFGFVFGAMIPSSARSIAEGRVTVDATKRLTESTSYALEFLTPGGYERYAAATKSACRLRLGHAAMAEALRRGGWDESIYGAPISVGDTLGGAMLGVPFTALAAERIGYRFTSAEREALAQLGAMLAYRHGVPEHLLPTTAAQQRHVVYLILRAYVAGVDPEASKIVLDSLQSANQGGRIAPLLRAFANGYARLILGDALCDQYNIARTPLTRLIPLQKPFISTIEALRQRVPFVHKRLDHLNERMWNTWLPKAWAAQNSTAEQYKELLTEKLAR